MQENVAVISKNTAQNSSLMSGASGAGERDDVEN